ncbi:hypothetical protein F66182_1456 [Fusarium sp. NRRL 66182]|nr:hypothetical protein F66182_1456 [Fusarium sp. NRRL 66182]
MFSKTSLLWLGLPAAVLATGCQLLANNQTEPFDPIEPANQTQPTNGTDFPPDNTPWIPTCKLPRTGMPFSIGHGFTSDCIPGTGTIQARMIFVDFSDAESLYGETPETLYDFFVPESAEWFRTASYGKLELNITADVSQFYRMPHPISSYDWDVDMNSRRQYAYVEDALDAYTNNGQKPPPASTDILYIVPTRGAAARMTRSYGSGFSAWTRDLQFVSKRAVTFGTDPYSSWGFKALNHETGHSMCIPDYYPSASGLLIGHYTGGWSLMGNLGGSAPDFFAWDKWRLGWLSDDAVDCVLERGTSTHTLTPVEIEGGTKAVVVAADQFSALVAEARVAKGVDDKICATGVLLYTVDTSLGTAEGSIRVIDATPNSSTCDDGSSGSLNDGTLSMNGTRSIELHAWGVKVALVDDSNDKFQIKIDYS